MSHSLGLLSTGKKRGVTNFPVFSQNRLFRVPGCPPAPPGAPLCRPPGPKGVPNTTGTSCGGRAGGFANVLECIISPVGLTPLLSKSQKPTVMHPRLYRREPGGPLDVETCTAERRRWPPGPPQAAEPAFEPFRLRAGTAPVLGICHRCNVPALPVPVGGPCGWKPPQRQNPPALAKHFSLVASERPEPHTK